MVFRASKNFISGHTRQAIRGMSSNTTGTSSSAGAVQPKWLTPQTTKLKSPLKLYNSLTRTKEVFTPVDENQITWYSCGPTVYDASHMGHARNYVTIDINRRILQDYFGYNVLFIQNVTDIDDKIIIKSRQEHLYKEFVAKNASVTLELISEVTTYWNEYVAKNLPAFEAGQGADFGTWATTFDTSSNPKHPMYVKLATLANELIKKGTSQDISVFLQSVKDVVVPLLDSRLGSSVTDPSIFRQTSSYWENQYDNDMDKLNVLPLDVTTRVSEFIPEIISFVQGIIDRGYAYPTKDGSVYFNSAKFDSCDHHDYAKLLPWSKSDMSLIEEGEGSLTSSLSREGKLSNSDFALWKSSKPGEPFFESPWGLGRPGWHIECSVMASSISPEKLDIHSGGIDLLFPHHDNELAQSEAYYDCPQWVNYFLHTGHLHIEGQKMSKSLKNFITIDEALLKYSARQLRLCFALVQWNNQLDFKESLINEVRSIESTFNKFFTTVRALNDDYKHQLEKGAIISKYVGLKEHELALALQSYKVAVDELFRDNLSTPQLLKKLVELISKLNLYIQSTPAADLRIQSILNVLYFVTKILGTLGFDTRSDRIGWKETSGSENGAAESSADEILMPYVKVLSQFRDVVRQAAIKKQDYSVILKAADEVRDKDLLKLRVSLDDRSGDSGALIKFINEQEALELLLQQEKDTKLLELKKQKQKENQLKELLKLLEKLEKSKMPPSELFKSGDHAGKFSEYDADGIPTKDAAGEEVTKSARKKLTKLYELQKKLHNEYLASLK